MNKILSFVLLVSIISFIGCGDSPVYSKYLSVEEPWKHESPLQYEIDIKSETEYYNLVLALSYGTDFGYQNLYVKITTEYPNKSTAEDIVSFNLTDGSGSFLGDCNSSKCVADIFLQENFRFQSSGKHIIRIYQNSRDPELEGIIGAEMKLLKAVKVK